jgi:multimeric flavodoxin WrbA
MRTTLWIGGEPGDAAVARTAAAVARALEDAGDTVSLRLLHTAHVAWCQGCFECWTHTPGQCRIDDDGRGLAAEYVRSEAVVLVARATCGGYDAVTKGALDRLLGTLLPFFVRIEGETHHALRYARPPALGVVAVCDGRDADEERTLRVLVGRNALNTGAPTVATMVVDDHAHDALLGEGAHGFVARLHDPASPVRSRAHGDVLTALPSMPLAADGAPPRRATVLVGSAKPGGTSTSEALAESLVTRLGMHGIEATWHRVARDGHSARGLAAIVDDVRASDLLIVATPVYFDALPALVVNVLEALLAEHRTTPMTHAPALVGLLNCGFPEVRHSAVAATILALAARRLEMRWAGALCLGGGQAIAGRPIAKVGGMVRHQRHALERAGDALALGRSIPADVRGEFALPMMPALLYAVAGDAGWLWTAAHEGALRRLRDRPYAPVPV